eukprot:1019943-Rhodomonas_salina.2
MTALAHAMAGSQHRASSSASPLRNAATTQPALRSRTHSCALSRVTPSRCVCGSAAWCHSCRRSVTLEWISGSAQTAMTVAAYFASKNVTLRYPHLPCLVTAERGTTVYYPLELCSIISAPPPSVVHDPTSPHPSRQQLVVPNPAVEIPKHTAALELPWLGNETILAQFDEAGLAAAPLRGEWEDCDSAEATAGNWIAAEGLRLHLVDTTGSQEASAGGVASGRDEQGPKVEGDGE